MTKGNQNIWREKNKEYYREYMKNYMAMYRDINNINTSNRRTRGKRKLESHNKHQNLKIEKKETIINF